MADIKLRLVLQDGQRVTATLDTANSLLATMLANAEKLNRTFTGGLPQVKQRIETLLQQPLEEVQVTLGELAEAKEVLDAALLSAANTEARADIIQLQNAVEGLEKDLLKAASAAGNVDDQLGGAPSAGSRRLTGNLNTLGQAAFQVGSAFEDFLIAGARGAANNINFLIGSVAPLGGTLGIIAGVIASIGISVGTATGFFDDLFATLTGGVDSIDEVKQKLQSLVDFDFNLGVTINEENINQVSQNITQLVAKRQELLDTTEQSLASVKAELEAYNDLLTQEGFTEELVKQGEQLKSELSTLEALKTVREASLKDAQAELEIVRERGLEIEANTRRKRDFIEAGAIDNEVAEEEERIQDERERRAKELAKLREQLADQLRAAQIQAIEDQEERAIAAVRAEFEERISLANQVGDSSAAIELERLLSTRIAQIRAGFREQELQKELQFQSQLNRIREQQRVLDGEDEADVVRERIETLQELLEAEELTTERRNQLRVELAQAELDLTRILKEQSDEQIKTSQRQAQEAERYADALISAQERLAVANGVPIINILRQRQQALELQLQNTSLTLQQRSDLELEFIETQAEIADEELRLQQQRAQQIAAFLSQVVGAFEEAFAFEPTISQEEINNQRQIFRTTEQDLRDSLQRREVSQAQFVARMNELDRQRADFFREVQEEQVSVAERTARALAGILAEAAKRAIINKISEAIADQIAFHADKLPLPALLAVGAAAYASLRAIQNRLIGESGFRKGGYTGAGSPDDVAGVAHRGEFYFTSTATSGQVAQLEALHKMMQRGVRLKDIMGAYNDYSGIMEALSRDMPGRSIERVVIGGRAVSSSQLVPSLEKVVTIQEGHGRELARIGRTLDAMRTEMGGLRGMIQTYSRQAFDDGFDRPRMYENIERIAAGVEKTLKSVDRMRRG